MPLELRRNRRVAGRMSVASVFRSSEWAQVIPNLGSEGVKVRLQLYTSHGLMAQLTTLGNRMGQISRRQSGQNPLPTDTPQMNERGQKSISDLKDFLGKNFSHERNLLGFIP